MIVGKAIFAKRYCRWLFPLNQQTICLKGPGNAFFVFICYFPIWESLWCCFFLCVFFRIFLAIFLSAEFFFYRKFPGSSSNVCYYSLFMFFFVLWFLTAHVPLLSPPLNQCCSRCQPLSRSLWKRLLRCQWTALWKRFVWPCRRPLIREGVILCIFEEEKKASLSEDVFQRSAFFEKSNKHIWVRSQIKIVEHNGTLLYCVSHRWSRLWCPSSMSSRGW